MTLRIIKRLGIPIAAASLLATLGGLLVMSVQNTRNAARRTQDV